MGAQHGLGLTASKRRSFLKHPPWICIILTLHRTQQKLGIKHSGLKAEENICLGKAWSHELSKVLLGSSIFNVYLKELPGAMLWLLRPGPHFPKVYEMRLSFE